jgi:hypothetical protein
MVIGMRTDGLPDGSTELRDITHDAVVVIPGIMGSELCHRGTDRVVWGVNDLRWLSRAWTHRDGMAELALTDAEQDALAHDTGQLRNNPLYPTTSWRYPKTARLEATRLLRFPAAAPFLHGFEPYTPLLRRIRQVVADPAAILEFAYDWRLPVEFNAHLLATAITTHLQQWRAHPAQEEARRAAADPRPARLVLVAHSMGGLLARGLSLIPGATDGGVQAVDIRTTITLGTPFYGSAKAVVLLNTGSGAPLPMPHRRLRAVAATMPGVYDLLPTYRCLHATDATGVEDVVRFTPAHVVAVGGDRELAEAALAHHDRLETTELVGHRAVVGVAQRTWQSLRLNAGTVLAEEKSYRWDGEDLLRDGYGRPLYTDRRGDGTVYRGAAAPLGIQSPPIPLAQQHGALASSSEAADFVCAALTDWGSLGIGLGAEEGIGLDVPDVVTTGEPFDVAVTGEDDPAALTCRIHDAATGEQVSAPRLGARRNGTGLTVQVRLAEPGLFRVAVTTGGSAPVSQLVLVTPADGVEST